MSRHLHLGLSLDAFDFAFDLPLEPIEDAFRRLVERASEAREAEVSGFGQRAPLRFYVECPHCQADATFLGSTYLDDRKVRMCLKCRSLFEVV